MEKLNSFISFKTYVLYFKVSENYLVGEHLIGRHDAISREIFFKIRQESILFNSNNPAAKRV